MNQLQVLRTVKNYWIRGQLRDCFRLLKELELTNLNNSVRYIIDNNIGCYYFKIKKYWASLDYFHKALKYPTNIILTNVQECCKALNRPIPVFDLDEEPNEELLLSITNQQFDFRIPLTKRTSRSTHETPRMFSPASTQRNLTQMKKCYQAALPQIQQKTTRKRPSSEFVKQLYMNCRIKHSRLQKIIINSYQNDQQVKSIL